MNLKSTDGLSNSIRGVLWGSRGAWLTLKDSARLIPDPTVPDGVKAERIDGDVVIHRSNVAYIQVLP